MSVRVATNLGELVITLHTKEAPKTCLNFLKLCKVKYYHHCYFHRIERDFMAQTGDPSGTGRGGESIDGVLFGPQARYFDDEFHPNLHHKTKGTVSMANAGRNKNGSQFFLTLAGDLDYLDEQYTVFGQVSEGLEVLDRINEVFCDEKGRPMQDVWIKRTKVLDDPFPDPKGLIVPDRSPPPSKEFRAKRRIAADESITLDKDVPVKELESKRRAEEADVNALTLEILGDLPYAEIKPPENVLFVCKLNPVTQDEDLRMIFSRFGEMVSCEVIRDRKTGESLCYAFIEFDKKDSCEEAYFKMDNVLIDDRRIHVDFSQSVSKLHKQWYERRRERMGPGTEFKVKDQFDPRQQQGAYAMVFDPTRPGPSHGAEREDRRRDHRDRKSPKRRARLPEPQSDRPRHDRPRSRSPSERYRRDRDHRDQRR